MGRDEALAAFRRGDDAEAARLAREDLDRATVGGDAAARVDALCMLARVALRDGRLDEVGTRAVEAERVADDQGDQSLRRMPTHLRAVAARMAGDLDEARVLYRRSIALNEELGEDLMAAVEHRNLAYVEIRAGEPELGRQLLAEARRRLADVHSPALEPYLSFDAATEAALDGDDAEASAKLARAERAFEEQGVVPDPDDAREMAELRGRLDAAGHPGAEGRTPL